MTLLVSQGNKKLGKDTLILNICSSHDCPSRELDLCQVPPNRCYGFKDELRYPHTLVYRRLQEKQWDSFPAWDLAEDIIEMAERKRKNFIDYVRLNEAGDFRNQADVDKASKMAAYLERATLRVYCYTARSDLDFSKTSSNLVVNGSGFMVDNCFKVVEKEKLHLEKSKYRCPGNCRGCTFCKMATGSTIITPLRLR